ncbi:MAG: acyl-CoA reductase [Chthoniobacteraceae bacterium]
MKNDDAIMSEYRALQARVMASLRDDLSGTDFASLALDIHAFQRRRNEPYGRWCANRHEPVNWREIPAVPQSMFKRFRLSCIPPSLVTKTFRSSGTTSSARSELHLPDTALYEAALLAGWRRLGQPRLRSILLSRKPDESPDSSLTHMFGTLARSETAAATFDPDGSETLLAGKIREDEPVAIFGTALAFAHLFEQPGARRLRLAPGSFAVETGGFKGSRREISKRDLYAKFGDHLGIPPEQICNEYGMCELASQFYTRGLNHPHSAGPWMRALVIDPVTGAEAAPGATGVLRIFDLASVAGVLAIDTADFAIRRQDGFELLGRDPGVLPRGCSISADEALSCAAAIRTPELPSTAIARRPAQPIPDTAARAMAIARAAAAFPFLGGITTEGLLGLVTAELGHAGALDGFVPCGGHFSRAVAPRTILHVISGNTPAAALQTIIRGLLLGSRNLCKLPSEGLPDAERFRALLPEALAMEIEFARELPASWLALADAAIVFGRDETIATLRHALRPGIPFIGHGHKISFVIIFADPDFESVPGAARDVSVFDQQGCLSPHVLFIRENGTFTAVAYARRLAAAMADFNARSPRGTLALSDENGIRTLRDEVGFRASAGEPITLFASEDTAWTVVADATPGFPDSPRNRVIFVKPLPPDLPGLLAPLRAALSTCGIWPATPAHAEFAAASGAMRICPLGKMQSPPLTWHHDGQPVLAPLVRWVDFEPD